MIVIFDLEATCDDTTEVINEIIEIGAVKLNDKGEVIDTFSRFAKPYDGVILTDFCKQLTTITQNQINTADNLDDVLIDFYDWSYDCELLSWGGFDMNQIDRDVKKQGIENEIDLSNMRSRHRNFKQEFTSIKKLKRGVGVRKALNILNLQFEGTPHRGIDDAKNIANIYLKTL